MIWTFFLSLCPSRCALSALCLGLLLTAPAPATVLRNCFANAGTYQIEYNRELSSSENVANTASLIDDHAVGAGSEIYAQCSCPGNLTASSTVYGIMFAGSPLATGSQPNYGYLTDKFDLHVDAFSNAINSPDGSGLYPLQINQYPSTMVVSQPEKINSVESVQTVCSAATQPESGVSPRAFKWNVLNLSLYIKSPILGQEVIPPTLVESTSACLYFGSGMCSSADAQPVANIWLSGYLSAPLSCTINAGSTIEVDFGGIVRGNFTTPGAPPSGFALKNVDINFHCDNAAVSNTEKIKLTLTADQGVADSGDPVIANAIDRDDVGIRMYDTSSNGVHLDGSSEFAIQLDAQGNGSIKMQAAPVATTRAQPQAGPFESNVTVQMDLR